MTVAEGTPPSHDMTDEPFHVPADFCFYPKGEMPCRSTMKSAAPFRGAPATGIRTPNNSLSVPPGEPIAASQPIWHPIGSPIGCAARSLARDVMASLNRVTLALRRTKYRRYEPLHTSLFPGLQFPVAGKKPLLIGIECEG
ncbi:hypothetical protein C7413_13752 [Paraburkholderia silvatlantica]|nr:hypothetical protein C7411_13652 [Paraburkholderia silvatlantica]PXW26074.1 hypothetical protein C7413_13752 [Paraburkholderia silvatlantica]